MNQNSIITNVCGNDRVGGGLGFLVKSNLQCDEINLSPFKNGVLEVQAIDLHLVNGTKLSVLNYYNPNKDVCPTEFQHYLKQLHHQW